MAKTMTKSATLAHLAEKTTLSKKQIETVLDETLARWFTPEAVATRGHPAVEYARKRLLADDAELIARYWEALGEHDVTAALPSIRVPMTFIAGARDLPCAPETMEPMARAVPGAAFEVIDGPHILPLEQPRAFRAARAIRPRRRTQCR